MTLIEGQKNGDRLGQSLPGGRYQSRNLALGVYRRIMIVTLGFGLQVNSRT